MQFLRTTLVAGLCLTAYAENTGAPQKGAKALFYDQTSNNTLTASAPSATGPSAGAHPVSHLPANSSGETTAGTNMPANTGLKYWVELIEPNESQIMRVSSTRVFHSGERIRLHFESNVDGRITLLQMSPNGGSQTLFPDARISSGNNHIKAGADSTVPGPNAWFTLDNQAGVERLLVFLSGEASGVSPVSSHASPISLMAAAPPAAPLDPDQTARLVSQIHKQGGKGLFLQVDDKSSAPADYAVKPISYSESSSGSGSAAGNTLAIEIQLKHQ